MSARPKSNVRGSATLADEFERLSTSEELYRTLVESAADGIVVLEDDVFVDCNSKALDVFGRSRDDLIGKTPFQTAPERPEDAEQTEDRGRDYLERAYAGEPMRFEWEHVTADGIQRYLYVTLTRFDLPDGPRLLAIVRDITETKLADQELKRRIQFQTRLAEISSEFSSATLDAVEDAIDRALPKIAENYRVDRMSLWWFEDEGRFAYGTLLYGFDAQTTEKVVQPFDSLPWIVDYFYSGNRQPLFYPADLPAEATVDRAYYESRGVKTCLIVPLTIGEDIVGVAGMATTTEHRVWTEEQQRELELFCQLLGNTWIRYQNELQIKEQKERLEQRVCFLTRLAEISGSFATATPEDIDDFVDTALQRIAADYGFDRASLWQMDKHAQCAYRIREWVVDGGFETERIVFPFAEAPWISQRILAGDSKAYALMDDLPSDASADRAYFRNRGMKSGLLVPFTFGGELYGVAGLAALKEERSWTEEEKTELILLTHLLGNAWSRLENDRRIRDREQALVRSQRVANVGSYSVYMKDGSPLRAAEASIRHSRQANRIYGIKDGMESLKLVDSLLHADDSKRVSEILRETMRTGRTTMEMDYRAIRPDGRLIYIEDRAELDHDENGQITRVFGTVKDVTDRIEAQKKLEIALAEIRSLRDQLQAENILLREEVRAAKGFDTIVGDSERLKNALVAAEKVAPTDVTVLILGETGTGKELVARSIHELSERNDAPLICVNCAALSSDLIESELFGHEVGAFTGAQKLRKGRFELAHGGTLFLDEIGDLPLDVQAKLLRVLQSGEFERLGGGTTLNVDVRVIAATNRDLRGMVDKGEFRADLYYRINSFPVELPPLRDRLDDIPALANHFVHKYEDELGKEITAISEAMMRHLSEQAWPGNVRELEGVIQRAMIASSGSVLDYRPSGIRVRAAQPAPDVAKAPDTPSEPPEQDLNAMQRKHIRDVLERCNWVIAGDKGAAAALGIPPSSLRSRMKRLGISRPH